MTDRRTKRRYAHELYPHEEGTIRPLEVEVPYLYARALGLEIGGTSWFTVEPRSIAGDRVDRMIGARHVALLADALAQSLVGQEAWEWAESMLSDESGETVYERAVHYGVDPTAIKPYQCGDEPNHHDHYSEPDRRGARFVDRVDGRESECDECTELAPPADVEIERQSDV